MTLLPPGFFSADGHVYDVVLSLCGGIPSYYLVSTQLQFWLFCCWGCGCCWAVTIPTSSPFFNPSLMLFNDNIIWVTYTFQWGIGGVGWKSFSRTEPHLHHKLNPFQKLNGKHIMFFSIEGHRLCSLNLTEEWQTHRLTNKYICDNVKSLVGIVWRIVKDEFDLWLKTRDKGDKHFSQKKLMNREVDED